VLQGTNANAVMSTAAGAICVTGTVACQWEQRSFWYTVIPHALLTRVDRQTPGFAARFEFHADKARLASLRDYRIGGFCQSAQWSMALEFASAAMAALSSTVRAERLVTNCTVSSRALECAAGTTLCSADVDLVTSAFRFGSRTAAAAPPDGDVSAYAAATFAVMHEGGLPRSGRVAPGAIARPPWVLFRVACNGNCTLAVLKAPAPLDGFNVHPAMLDCLVQVCWATALM
jgi:hypothetical protein